MRFNVEEIYTVIRKSEPERFDFECRCRAWDGFVCFTQGEGSILLNARAYPIHPGTAVLLRRGDSYRFSVGAPCTYITSAFVLSACKELDDLPRIAEPGPALLSLLEEAESFWQQQSEDGYMQTLWRVLCLYTTLIGKTREGESVRVSDSYRAAVCFLRKNYDRGFTVSELAAACNLSPSRLRALFREKSGMSVLAYRDLLRIRRAQELLSFSEDPIEEIAVSLGYCDVYYFSRAFRRLCGIPPGEYRRRQISPPQEPADR